MKAWNLAAEVLGFISACLLLWPAIVQNGALRRAYVMAMRFGRSKTGLGRLMRHSPTVIDVGPARWSAVDQWLLTGGAVTLLCSFLIKVVVVWNTP